MASHLTALHIRGPNSVSTLRVTTANVLTVNSSFQCSGNIVNANFTGNIVFPEHLRDGVLFVQDGMLKTSNISEYEGGIVLPGNITGNTIVVEDTFGSEMVYIDNDTFRIDGTLYVSGVTPIDAANVSIEAVGGVRASQFLTASDARLKKDILPLDTSAQDQIGAALRSLTVKHWTDRVSGQSRMGLVADDVERVLPEAVRRLRGMVPRSRGFATYESSRRRHYTFPHHDLRTEDVISYTLPGTREKARLSSIEVLDDNSFVLQNSSGSVTLNPEEIYIQGVMVDDLKTIDYDVIIAALLVALQRNG